MDITLRGLLPNRTYNIQARATAGDESSAWTVNYPFVTRGDNVKPGPVTNLMTFLADGNMRIVWTAPEYNADGTPLEDLKDFRVSIRPIPDDPKYATKYIFTADDTATFPKEVNAAAFGGYHPNLSITVQARDIAGNLSDPVTQTKNKNRPSPPTSLVWKAVGNAYVASWNAPTTNIDGTAFTDPDGYEVKVSYLTTTKTFLVRQTTFDFSFEANKAAFGGIPRSPLVIEVRARDSVGQLSDMVTATASNDPPKKVTGVVGTPVVDGIKLKWTEQGDDDLTHYEVFSASTSGGAGVFQAKVPAPTAEYTHTSFAYNTDHFMYVVAVDVFGLRSPDSDRTAALRPKSPFTVDADPPGATTLSAATATTGTDKPAAVVLTWPKNAATDLAGYHIRYSLNTTPRNWIYSDVGDATATSTTISGLQSQGTYVFQIRAYDKSINPGAWSGEVSAVASESVIPMTNITSDIQIINQGILRSSNYVESTPTVPGQGWMLSPSQLNIEQGRVNARVVSAGELRSTVTITDPAKGTVGQPLWSLNLDGNMSINDAQVRGKIVVGAPSDSAAQKSAISIASSTWGSGGPQWAIRADGTFDLKSGTGARIELSSSALIGHNGTIETFRLGTNGALNLTGIINATGGKITGDLDVTARLSGGTISGANIYGSVYSSNENQNLNQIRIGPNESVYGGTGPAVTFGAPTSGGVRPYIRYDDFTDNLAISNPNGTTFAGIELQKSGTVAFYHRDEYNTDSEGNRLPGMIVDSRGARIYERLSFSRQTRQQINLYNETYGIGVQDNTLYYRSNNSYAWFQGGTHSSVMYDPGPGGIRLMRIDQHGNLYVKGNIIAQSGTTDGSTGATFNDADYVKITTIQTISGQKNFTGGIMKNSSSVYSVVENDARYALKSDVPAQQDLSNYWTKAQSDDRYYTKLIADNTFALKSSVISQTDMDARYPLKTDVYTKTEAINTFALTGSSYTKSEADATFLNKNGGTITGSLNVAGLVFAGGGFQANKDGWAIDIDHPTAGSANAGTIGWVGQRFRSRSNSLTEFGYILYQDNSLLVQEAGSGTENGRLTIGISNDTSAGVSDELWFQGSRRVVVNIGPPDGEIQTIVGGAFGATPTGNLIEFRANNIVQANITATGVAYIKGLVASGNASVSGTFSATGVSTFTGMATFIDGLASSSGTFSNTLGVTGAATLGSLTVNGTSELKGKVTGTGADFTGKFRVLRSDSSTFLDVDPSLEQITFAPQSISGDSIIDQSLEMAKLSQTTQDLINMAAAGGDIVVAGSNLLHNSSFEADTSGNGVPDGWTKSVQFIRDTTKSRSSIWGSVSYMIDHTRAETETTNLSPGIYTALATHGVEVTPGSSYIGSTWVWLDPLNTAPMRMLFRFIDADGATMSAHSWSVYADTAVTGKWQRLVTDAKVAPEGAVKVQIYPGYATIQPGMRAFFWVDDAMITEGTEVSPYQPKNNEILPRAISDDLIGAVGVSKLIAGTINTDDINLGTVGRVWTGADGSTKNSGSRLVFQGGGTVVSRGIFAYKGAVETVRLGSDGAFSLRSDTAAGVNRIDINSETGIKLIRGSDNLTTFNADLATGNLTITGTINATAGTIGGWDAANGNLSTVTGTATANWIQLAPSSGIWAGHTSFESANFSVSTSGALTAKTGSIGGFTMNQTDGLYSGSTTDRVQMKPAAGFWAGGADYASARFGVTNTGTWKATDGTLSGTLSVTGTISGGSIVGSVVRTAWSGTRTEMGGSGTNSSAPIRMYISNSSYPGTIDYFDEGNGYTGILLRDGYGTSSIQIGASGGGMVYVQGGFYVSGGTQLGNLTILGTGYMQWGGSGRTQNTDHYGPFYGRNGLYDGSSRVYSANNTPPYPVTSVNGYTGAVNLNLGVTALYSGNGISVNANTGGVTVTANVTSVNGRTGAVSGLSEAHTHPYLPTSNPSASGYVQASNGFYANTHLMINNSGSPILFFNGAGTRLGAVSGQIIYMQRNDGGVYATVYGGPYSNQSSIKSKKNVKRLEKGAGGKGKGRDKVKLLSPVSFEYSESSLTEPLRNKKTRLGLIAEEVVDIYPEAVNYDNEGRPGIDYSVITTALLLTVQEQQDQIDELKAMVEALGK